MIFLFVLPFLFSSSFSTLLVPASPFSFPFSALPFFFVYLSLFIAPHLPFFSTLQFFLHTVPPSSFSYHHTLRIFLFFHFHLAFLLPFSSSFIFLPLRSFFILFRHLPSPILIFLLILPCYCFYFSFIFSALHFFILSPHITFFSTSQFFPASFSLFHLHISTSLPFLPLSPHLPSRLTIFLLTSYTSPYLLSSFASSSFSLHSIVTVYSMSFLPGGVGVC
jgi:hypothetical protein